jgi:hypothetical protein
MASSATAQLTAVSHAVIFFHRDFRACAIGKSPSSADLRRKPKKTMKSLMIHMT